MKRHPLLILSLGLLLQSFIPFAMAQETATPPDTSLPPEAQAANPNAPTVDTNPVDNSTPLIGPSAANTDAAAAAQQTYIKRQEAAFAANQSIVDGERLYQSGQLDAAAERFKYALDNLPKGGTSAASYQKAANDLAVVRAAQGDLAIKAKKYSVAVDNYQQANQLVPSNEAYRAKLNDARKRLTEYNKSSMNVASKENNPAYTPEFQEKVEQTQKLLFEGDRFYETGQYDLAENRYFQVLALDPTNKSARGRLERLDRTRQRAAAKLREATRADAMAQVTAKWSETVPPDFAAQTVQKQTTEGSESKLARINKKLQDMRIPSLTFNQADIQTVIQVLYAKSQELDPTKEGINFVLMTESPATPAPTTPAKPGEAPASAPVAPSIAPVTIDLKDVPMINAIHFISTITNLQYKVEEHAVLFLPQDAASAVLQTRTFAVPPGFFEGGLKTAVAKPGVTESTKVDTVKIDVKQQLIDKGIQFPTGATAAFLAGSSRLVVKNTPDQLDIIDALVRASNVETPQVEIETRLAEFTDDQLKALTFNYNQYISISTTGGVETPDPYTNFRHSGKTNLRDSQNGISPNGLDSLLSGTSTTTPGTQISIGGVIGGNALGVVINMIDNMKGVDLLSAPKVTAKNRTRAKIEIIRELRYPSEYEKPTVNSTPFAIFAAGVTNPYVYLALPASPRQFAVKPIGVTMEVTPTTYPDQRIDLDMQPEVTDFEGFIDYGQSIRTRSSYFTPDPRSEGDVQTPSVVNSPVFNVRSIQTKVQVLDGQTVVLGGLIREDRQMINDKVPFFGDLPLVGRAFQSKVEKSVKKNLMIFVTARLVKSNGQALYNQDLAVVAPKAETTEQQ